MNRRTIFKSVAAVAGGTLLVSQKGKVYAASTERDPGAKKAFIGTKDGTQLFFEDWGTGQPVVFMHSAGLTWEQWNYNLYPLSRHVRCIAYDRRGHGRSSNSGGWFDYDVLADDLAEVLTQLNLERVVLVAHSMAAGEAVRYLTRHGSNRIAAVIMVGPTLPFILRTPDNPDGVAKESLEALRATWCRDFPQWVIANARPFFTPQTSDAMVQWGCSLMLHTSLRTNINCNQVLAETDFRKELTEIAVPTLIIHGDKDVSAQIDFTGRRTAQLIRKSDFKVYEGAAHGLFITHAERFNEDVLKFIKA